MAQDQRAATGGEARTGGGNGPTTQTATSGDSTTYRFKEETIDWNQLKTMGLSRDYLEKSGQLDTMLRGYQTDPQRVMLDLPGVKGYISARLSFRMDGDRTALNLEGVQQTPDLTKAYLGHVFSPEDKRNLLGPTGNMGRVVDLNYGRDNVPCFVSRDLKTNVIKHMKAESLKLPVEFKGVTFDKEQREALLSGEAIRLEGLQSKGGKEYDATVQVSAERRSLAMYFDETKLAVGQSFGGVQLTKEQVEALNSGGTVKLEGMKSKDNEENTYSRFVQIDPVSGRPAFTLYNPDSPEGNREIIIPESLGGVKLTDEDRNLLSEGKDIFVNDMTDRRGENWSSFAKLDMESGVVMYARDPGEFGQEANVPVPQKILGHEITASERAAFQDGKAVHIEGLQGVNGKTFDSWTTYNSRYGSFNYHDNDPNNRQGASQQQGDAARQDAARSQGQQTGGDDAAKGQQAGGVTQRPTDSGTAKQQADGGASQSQPSASQKQEQGKGQEHNSSQTKAKPQTPTQKPKGVRR